MWACYYFDMLIEWKEINAQEYETLNSWLSVQDKHNLCMTIKGWEQTALDIADCLKYMHNAQFKNIMGFANGKPVVALMFGIEQIEVLNLYNIVVNPACRNHGVAKAVILQLLKNNKSLAIVKPYKKMVVSTLPNNVSMHNLLKNLGFANMGFNGEYVVFEKSAFKTDERTPV